MPSKDVCVVLCTTPTADSKRIATELVDRQLAACVNIVNNVQSVYRWEGVVTEDTECLLIIKTPQTMFPKLSDALIELHPYEVPEILALDVQSGHAPYLEWILSSTQKSSE